MPASAAIRAPRAAPRIPQAASARPGPPDQTRQASPPRPIAPAEQLSPGWCRFLASRLKQTGEATVSATVSQREYTRPGPPNALAHVRGGRCNGPMSGPNRRRILGDRPGAAVADDRAMPQRRLSLAPGHVQTLRNARQAAAGCDPPPAPPSDLETRDGAEMPIVPNAAIRATGAHDQGSPKSARSRLTFGCIQTMIDEPAQLSPLSRST